MYKTNSYKYSTNGQECIKQIAMCDTNKELCI